MYTRNEGIFKMEKMNFNHGRIYKILDYIFQKYDKNFKKEFSYDEFNDQEALTEVLAELKEYRKTANIKVKKTKKNILVLSPLEIRYLKSLYIEQNKYEMSTRLNVLSIGLSLLALIVSAITYALPEQNWIVIIMLFMFICLVIYEFMNSTLSF